MNQPLNQSEKITSVRALRRVTQTVLPFVGVLVVLASVFFLRDLRLQMPLVVGGLLLVEFGVWKAAQNILPSERQFHTLRFEAESFIRLVRQLNTVALARKQTPSPEHQQAFEDIREAMRQSVDRIVEVAGKTDAEIANELESAMKSTDYQEPLS